MPMVEPFPLLILVQNGSVLATLGLVVNRLLRSLDGAQGLSC